MAAADAGGIIVSINVARTGVGKAKAKEDSKSKIQGSTTPEQTKVQDCI